MYKPDLAQSLPDVQLPLIHVVDLDDMILSNSKDADWYRILKNLPWLPYREIGATYYNALYDFNKNRVLDSSNVCENAKEASQRLLFGRATVDKNQPVLAEPQYNTAPVNPEQPVPLKFGQPSLFKPGQSAPIKPVQPHEISPGVIPSRQGGPKPKDFFALLKSFIGAPLLGFKAEPEEVHNLLTSNPAYARVCGFSPSIGAAEYYSTNVPSLRKLQQFDQIMTNYGLWEKAKLNEVRRNIITGVIKQEDTLVGDTTHYYANSGFETVGYVNEKGETQKKSQSKPTKPCRCENPAECQHPWILADDGAGTIVKGPKKIHWGHKTSILGLPLQGIPLDAVAVADAATHDG